MICNYCHTWPCICPAIPQDIARIDVDSAQLARMLGQLLACAPIAPASQVGANNRRVLIIEGDRIYTTSIAALLGTGPPGPPGPPGPGGKSALPIPGRHTEEETRRYMLLEQRGPAGPQGVPGIPGYSIARRGDDGRHSRIPGPAGPPGGTGPQGNDGRTGVGIPGRPGDDGRRSMIPGTQGIPGPIGPKGDSGTAIFVAGRHGDEGPRGRSIPGVNGLRGPVGPIGPVGPAGPVVIARGRDGEDGRRGTPIKGDKGDTGTAGPPGTPGLRGLTGYSIPGRAGEDGRRGVSIKGDKGNTGATGATGGQGLRGLTGYSIPGRRGDEGIRGGRGPMGLTGATGPAGPGTTSMPRGYWSGGELSYISATSIQVASAQWRDSSNANDLVLSSAMTKVFSSANSWTAGGGGFITDALYTLSGGFHVYLILNPTSGAVDVLARSEASGLSPTLPTGYTKYRRIGWVFFATVNNLLKFHQCQDIIQFDVPQAGQNIALNNTSALLSWIAPGNSSVKTEIMFSITYGPAAGGLIFNTDPDTTDTVGGAWQADALNNTTPSGTAYTSERFSIVANNSGQTRIRTTANLATVAGWQYGYREFFTKYWAF